MVVPINLSLQVYQLNSVRISHLCHAATYEYPFHPMLFAFIAVIIILFDNKLKLPLVLE